MNVNEVENNIFRLTVPFLDIFTTVYLVKTDEGVALFDTATYSEDADNYLLPFIKQLGLEDELKYVFISHNHRDHSGGLTRLLELFPNVTVLSRGIKWDNVTYVNDGDDILGSLKVVTVPGHSLDSMALYDTRSKTLISGDCLQLFGIYGSGEWGANIGLIPEYIDAIGKLRKMDIKCIYTAHDYHPCGYKYCGKEDICTALDACIEPFLLIKQLMLENSALDDEAIRELYHSKELPTVRIGVFSAVRSILDSGII